METGSSSCLIGAAGCAEFGSNVGGMGMLLLSLGITIALVGALFYYVRQRFEVLEVSHKEQIGVMQNFIESIGDQFHRMHSFIRQQGSIMFAGDAEQQLQQQQQQQQQQQSPTAAAAAVVPHAAALFSGGSLIDVSSDDDESDSDDSNDDSDYDDDSATSDTDAADFGGSIKIHDDIYIDGARARSNADDDDDDDDDSAGDATDFNKKRTDRDRASDIKIIELSAPRNRVAANDESDTDTDTDNYTDTDTDADDADDADVDADDADDADADGADKVMMNVTVIKSDSTYCEPAPSGESLQQQQQQQQQQQDASPPTTEAASGTVASRSMAIDLDLGELADIDIESISFSAQDAGAASAISGNATVPATSSTSGGENDVNKNKGGGAPYVQMSIKQLRKLVKFHNIDIHNQDISKLKREQLSEILAAANVKT